MSDVLTASERANLLAKLRADGCTCPQVELYVDRTTWTIAVGHESGCVCAPTIDSVIEMKAEL